MGPDHNIGCDPWQARSTKNSRDRCGLVKAKTQNSHLDHTRHMRLTEGLTLKLGRAVGFQFRTRVDGACLWHAVLYRVPKTGLSLLELDEGTDRARRETCHHYIYRITPSYMRAMQGSLRGTQVNQQCSSLLHIPNRFQCRDLSCGLLRQSVQYCDRRSSCGQASLLLLSTSSLHQEVQRATPQLVTHFHVKRFVTISNMCSNLRVSVS